MQFTLESATDNGLVYIVQSAITNEKDKLLLSRMATDALPGHMQDFLNSSPTESEIVLNISFNLRPVTFPAFIWRIVPVADANKVVTHYELSVYNNTAISSVRLEFKYNGLLFATTQDA